MSQTTVLIEQIHIGDRFRKDMGDISTLAKSIGDLGLLQPIVISENYQLIAGHRRLEACKSLGWIEVSVNIVNLADIVRGEFDENAMRKDFTISEMVAIKRNLEPVEREQAAERQHAGRPSEESAGGDVRERIASSLGVSHDTLKKSLHLSFWSSMLLKPLATRLSCNKCQKFGDRLSISHFHLKTSANTP